MKFYIANRSEIRLGEATVHVEPVINVDKLDASSPSNKPNYHW